MVYIPSGQFGGVQGGDTIVVILARPNQRYAFDLQERFRTVYMRQEQTD